jgi:hypothetical protein
MNQFSFFYVLVCIFEIASSVSKLGWLPRQPTVWPNQNNVASLPRPPRPPPSPSTMTLSQQAALSILIPINLEHRESPSSAPPSPADSLSSIDIQSDDENEREAVEKRLSRYYPTCPETVRPIVRPQLSCPDFGMGTARGMKALLKEPAPPVPTLSAFALEQSSPPQDEERMSRIDDIPTLYPRKGRQKNNFLPLNTVNKRSWGEIFGEDKSPPKKRHGLLLGRLHGYERTPSSHS